MKLTDELYQKGIQQKGIFSIINDDYVLLKKSMPCKDQDLESYIANINRAHNDGINIPCITDYKFIEGKTATFGTEDNKYSYTTGVFIEERAKGVCIDSSSIMYKSKEDYYLYLKSVQNYIEELTNRAMASQDVYDKFVDDYISLKKYNLNPDPKPLNFFFSKDNGFTIIDVIDQTDNELTYVPRYIFMGVIGYGLPKIYNHNWDNISFLPESLCNSYIKAQEAIQNKVIKALKNKNIDEEFIKNGLYYIKVNYDYKDKVIADSSVEEYINSYQR